MLCSAIYWRMSYIVVTRELVSSNHKFYIFLYLADAKINNAMALSMLSIFLLRKANFINVLISR